MNIKHKIMSGAVLGTIALSIFTQSAFAAININITNNGPHSKNGAAVIKLTKKVVVQKNATIANTFIVASSNTGNNSVKNNSGSGSITITAKNSTTTTNVIVTGGSNTNTSTGQGCCCDGGDTNVTISGNQAHSKNGVLVIDNCENVVVQSNATVANTVFIASSNTGGNEVKNNSGSGDITITTEPAVTTTNVTVTGGNNTNTVN